MDSQERDDYNFEQKGETKPMTSTKDAIREMDYGQEDSDSTIIQDYYIETDIEYSTSNTVTETTKETHKENAVASEVQITSVKSACKLGQRKQTMKKMIQLKKLLKLLQHQIRKN